jgi:hypothetical protein
MFQQFPEDVHRKSIEPIENKPLLTSTRSDKCVIRSRQQNFDVLVEPKCISMKITFQTSPYD